MLPSVAGLMSYHFLPDKEVSTKQEKLLFRDLLLLYRNRNTTKRLKVATADNLGFTREGLCWLLTENSSLLCVYFENHCFFLWERIF